jgi:hypothetical protein
MSKAVLVMDMPKSCNKCKFFNSQYRYCVLKGLPLKRKDGKYGKTKISKERADWCPLRELPEKKPKQVPVAYSYFGAYNNGWIPCSERLPEEGVPVNITWKNNNPLSYYNNIKNIPFTDTAILYKNKWYWYSCICLDILNEYGKNDADAVDKDIDIIAWQPLPLPYREEQEDGR